MPTFDYQAAKKAGYTEQQIQDYVAQRAQHGVHLTVVGMEDTPAQPKDTKTTVEKVGDAIGVGDFGRGLGLAAANTFSKDIKNKQQSANQLAEMTQKLLDRANKLPGGDKRKTELLKIVQENNKILSSQYQEDANQGPTNRQFLSSAANTALLVGGSGTIGGKGAVKGVLGTTKYATQPLKAAVAQSALQAGLTKTSTELGKGKKLGESLGAGAVSGLEAGAITGVIGGIAKALSGVGTGSSGAAYKASLGTKRSVDASTLMDAGITGSREQIKTKAYKLLTDTGNKISSHKDAALKVNVSQIAEYKPLQQLVQDAQQLGDTDQVYKTLSGIKGLDVKRIGNTIVLGDKNIELSKLIQIKSAIDKATAQSLLSGGRSTSVDQNTLNAVADSIRGLIAKYSPEIAKLEDTQSQAFGALEAIKAYSNSRASGGISWNQIVQRLVLRPGAITPAAKALRDVSTKAGPKTENLRRVIRAITISASNQGGESPK